MRRVDRLQITSWSVCLFLCCATAAAQDPPQITALVSSPRPSAPGTAVTISCSAQDADGDTLSFTWDFGDGSPAVVASAAASVQHVYAEAGHFRIVCQVGDGFTARTRVITQAVIRPPTASQPRSSATLIADPSRARLWVVNPDNDSVSCLDAATLALITEIPVGCEPRSIALAADDTLWVTCQRDDQLRVLSAQDGRALATITLPYGWAPFGVVATSDGSTCLVSAMGGGHLLRYRVSDRVLTGELAVGPTPRAIAVSGDGGRALVTRFISPQDHGEVWDVDLSAWTLRSTIALAPDPGPDSVRSGRGIPNYLLQVVITPDGREAWVCAKKDNTLRGLARDGQTLDPEMTVRCMLARIDLASGTERLAARLDLDDRELPSNIAFTTAGDYAVVAFQGNNGLDVLDAYSGDRVTGVPECGLIAPSGLVIDPSGRLTVQGYLSRTAVALDLSQVAQSDGLVIAVVGSASTIVSERLPPEVLRGKRIFYNARDPRMNRAGYISCATCHLDGGHDGRVFDFTDRGEGLRSTIPLNGRRGTGHGRVHWTGNFDEIQDFEHAMRGSFGGTGYMDDTDFTTGTRNTPLGDAKAGVSADLDAMAAYVASLDAVPRSPYRRADGRKTSAGIAGRQIFRRLDCQSCHAGADFTDSGTGLLHDVGTQTPASGMRLGQPLTGFDTPTLKGLWDTAPYLHDGSAPTLDAVFDLASPASPHARVRSLASAERDDLLQFLQQLDEREIAVSSASTFDPDAEADAGADERGNRCGAGGFAAVMAIATCWIGATAVRRRQRREADCDVHDQAMLSGKDERT